MHSCSPLVSFFRHYIYNYIGNLCGIWKLFYIQGHLQCHGFELYQLKGLFSSEADNSLRFFFCNYMCVCLICVYVCVCVYKCVLIGLCIQIHTQKEKNPKWLCCRYFKAIMFRGLTVKIIKINILYVDYITVNSDEDRKLFAVVSNSATPWTVAHQAPLSMGFSRQGYWSG